MVGYIGIHYFITIYNNRFVSDGHKICLSNVMIHPTPINFGEE